MGETIGEEGGGGGRHGSQGQQGRQGGDKDEFLLLFFLSFNIFCTSFFTSQGVYKFYQKNSEHFCHYTGNF